MEISDRDALAIQRAVEDIGAGARSAACETKQYADVLADNLRHELAAEMRRELASQAKRHQREIDAVAAVLNRSAGFVSDTPTDGTNKLFDRTAPESKAFEVFVRGGPDRLNDVERKLLSVSNDPGGGYLVPSTVAPEILHVLREFSPIRQLARSVSTSGDKLDFPVMTSGPEASWVGEVETRPETTATFGDIEIELGELACYFDITNRLLEDSAFDVFNFMSERLGESFAVSEGAAFLTGNGLKKPYGILTYSTLPKTASGDATTVKTDALIDMDSSLKAPYQQNATWVMSRGTLAVVRKMKDGAGNYLWAQGTGIVGGKPATILGRPYALSPDMPAVAAGTLPILLGDFRSGYAVLNKGGNQGLSIMRDPFTQATVGKTRFHARFRVGGAMIQSEAIVAMQVAASL